MKKILFIIAIFCFLTTAHGQQFSFQMFFTDAIGNKDTITFGYDLLATDSIDTSFGEVNIIKQALKTTLDVRITDEWENRYGYGKPGTFHTKKQITYYDCSKFDDPHVQAIDIYTKHWPVTATWDNTVFNDACRNGSVFTSTNPGGWWDTGSPSNLVRQELTADASVTFSSNISGYFNESYGYIKNNDTIPVFWQAIADISILYLSVDELSSSENVLKVFPNPTSESLSIQVPIQFGAVKMIEIFSALGQLVKSTKNANDINISHLDKGIYFVGVANEKGKKMWTRIIKE